MSLIDREKLIEEIRTLAEKHHMNGEYEVANGVLKSITRVKEAPEATDRKSGEWIETKRQQTISAPYVNEVGVLAWAHNTTPWIDGKCSICGAMLGGANFDDFCSKCGAKMKKVATKERGLRSNNEK